MNLFGISIFSPWTSCFDAEVLWNSRNFFSYCCPYEGSRSISAVHFVTYQESREIQVIWVIAWLFQSISYSAGYYWWNTSVLEQLLIPDGFAAWHCYLGKCFTQLCVRIPCNRTVQKTSVLFFGQGTMAGLFLFPSLFSFVFQISSPVPEGDRCRRNN